MHIEDYVSGALHAYANEWLSASPVVQLELRAMADHLGAYLVEGLGLKQEWAAGVFVNGKLDDIDDQSSDPQEVAAILEVHQRLDDQDEAKWGDEGVTANLRRAIMTRLYTDWAEDPTPVLDLELLDLVEADGEACATPNQCNWFSAGDEHVCSACGKTEAKESGPVVFQDQ